MRRHLKILAFITELRDSYPGAERVYLCGSCFRLFRVLRVLWPEAECWYDGNHAITRIGGHWYDITGAVRPGRHLPLGEAYSEDQQARLLALRCCTLFISKAQPR